MNDLEFAPSLNIRQAQSAIGDALRGGFGEIYAESSTVESLVYDQGRLRSNQLSQNHGIGARRVIGAETIYAHVEGLDDRAVADAVGALGAGGGGLAAPKRPLDLARYQRFDMPPLAERLALLASMDAAIRAFDPRVINVTITLAASLQDVAIIHAEGAPLIDARPMSRLGIAVTVEENGRRETGSAGKGGRFDIRELMQATTWDAIAREAMRIALVNITAQPTRAGEQTLLLGPGWPGVLFHEAVGHGLEGDFNRRGSSAFSKLMGQRVAAKGVNVIDDGTIDTARGSLNFDDEGHETRHNTLIEDGILVSYMNDRLNGELLGTGSTGNCRRESFAHAPVPRMTNTFLDNGDTNPADLLAEIKSGIYAVGFGGGQVDITSGKFVFNCTEAYRVENGEILYPVKGATLIGDGPTALTKIVGIGNDRALDPGIGNCGKAGQWVPVTVGQPSVLMEGITVGGTELAA